MQPTAAFCLRSNYTVGAPAAISRRNGPRVIKSARAGNAVGVAPARLCGTGGRSASPAGVDVGTGGPSAVRCTPWSVLGCILFLAAAGAGRRRSRRCSGNVDRTGIGPGRVVGTNGGAVGVCTAGQSKQPKSQGPVGTLCPFQGLRTAPVRKIIRRQTQNRPKFAFWGDSALKCGSSSKIAFAWRRLPPGTGWHRPRRHSGHLHKTGTESGYMAGTSAGAILGVHCRP